MSTAPLRGAPRWSTAGAPTTDPVSIAGLPGGNAIVSVGPPFQAGSTRLAAANAVPGATAASTCPAAGRAWGHCRFPAPAAAGCSIAQGLYALPPTLSSNSTLRRVKGAPLSLAMPAAKQTAHGAALCAIVTFCKVSAVAAWIAIAPPSPPRAMLPTKVELLMLPSSTPP